MAKTRTNNNANPNVFESLMTEVWAEKAEQYLHETQLLLLLDTSSTMIDKQELVSILAPLLLEIDSLKVETIQLRSENAQLRNNQQNQKFLTLLHHETSSTCPLLDDESHTDDSGSTSWAQEEQQYDSSSTTCHNTTHTISLSEQIQSISTSLLSEQPPLIPDDSSFVRLQAKRQALRKSENNIRTQLKNAQDQFFQIKVKLRKEKVSKQQSIQKYLKVLSDMKHEFGDYKQQVAASLFVQKAPPSSSSSLPPKKEDEGLFETEHPEEPSVAVNTTTCGKDTERTQDQPTAGRQQESTVQRDWLLDGNLIKDYAPKTQKQDEVITVDIGVVKTDDTTCKTLLAKDQQPQDDEDQNSLAQDDLLETTAEKPQPATTTTTMASSFSFLGFLDPPSKVEQSSSTTTTTMNNSSSFLGFLLGDSQPAVNATSSNEQHIGEIKMSSRLLHKNEMQKNNISNRKNPQEQKVGVVSSNKAKQLLKKTSLGEQLSSTPTTAMDSSSSFLGFLHGGSQPADKAQREEPAEDQNKSKAWNRQGRLIESALHNQQRASLPWALLGLLQGEDTVDDHNVDVNAAFQKVQQWQEVQEHKIRRKSPNYQARLIGQSALHNQRRATLRRALLGPQQEEETADDHIKDVNAAFQKKNEMQKNINNRNSPQEQKVDVSSSKAKQPKTKPTADEELEEKKRLQFCEAPRKHPWRKTIQRMESKSKILEFTQNIEVK